MSENEPPFDHHFWSDTLEFVLEHWKDGDTLYAPEPFKGQVPQWEINDHPSSDDWALGRVSEQGWHVIHKGIVDWIYTDVARHLMDTDRVFANEVFVVYAPYGRGLDPYGGKHFVSLRKKLQKVLASEYVFDNRAALQKTAREAATAVSIGDGRVLCKAMGRYKFVADMVSVDIAPHIIQDGFWESWISLAIFRRLKQGGYFVDVGANMGYYTAMFANASGNVGHTLAIEPQDCLQTALVSNCVMNGAHGHWTVLQAAAGASEGMMHLYHPVGYRGSAYLSEEPHRPDDVHDGEVKVVCIDDYIRDWPRVDMVKIDVEGAVPEVWAGLKETRQREETLYFVEYVSSWPRDRQWLQEVKDEGFHVGYVNHRGEIVPGDPKDSDTWTMVVVSRKKVMG